MKSNEMFEGIELNYLPFQIHYLPYILDPSIRTTITRSLAFRLLVGLVQLEALAGYPENKRVRQVILLNYLPERLASFLTTGGLATQPFVYLGSNNHFLLSLLQIQRQENHWDVNP